MIKLSTIFKLLIDTEADISLKEFYQSIILPLQHGNGHLHYSADNVLLWFFTWLAITDEELSQIEKDEHFKLVTQEMLDRESSDHCFVLMHSARPNSLMKDKSVVKEVLKRVGKNYTGLSAQRRRNGKLEFWKNACTSMTKVKVS